MRTECEENPVLQRDLEEIAQSSVPFEKLAGKTVFVTGATGLIGSQIVRALGCRNRLHGDNIHLVVLARSYEKAETLFRPLIERGELTVVLGDINALPAVDGPIDYIIHGASATSSQYFVSHPVETILTAFDGTRAVLELATEN